MVTWPGTPFLKSSKKHQASTTRMDINSQQSLLQRTVFFPSGDKYTGEWLDNKKHVLYFFKGGGLRCGINLEPFTVESGNMGDLTDTGPTACCSKKQRCMQRSTVVNGKMEESTYGYGTNVYGNSALYEGVWSEDQRAGWGKMNYENGDVYEGEWMKDKHHGHGIIRYANGNWYEGGWREGKKHGKGKVYYPDKGQLYEGLWVDGDAKCGTFCDFGREKAATPTKYPIPQLLDAQSVLQEASSAMRVGTGQEEQQQHVSPPHV
ncbi:MORN repeat-containing protein 3 isoform X2 [Takifugu flavidus]|uniref:MORN repeat-containing protein 3 isoform X2 n=1 Tax=Takifugu flavidus TaxID=433684 RepID=UPI002544935E|nr:MORN repeat-containing protein 3 isoform X2 [Takifugu flavidus]